MLQREIAPRSIENVGTLYDIATQALTVRRNDPSHPQHTDRVLVAMKREKLNRYIRMSAS